MAYNLLCKILQRKLRRQKHTPKSLQSLFSCGNNNTVITMRHIVTDLRIPARGAPLGTERAELCFRRDAAP